MKLLLDENVPAPMTSTVKTLLRRSHEVQHVNDVPGWSGTKDLQLYQNGLQGLGLAMATVCAALPSVLQELAAADGQRLVTLRAIDPGRDHRYAVCNPASDPPKFWPKQAA